MQIEHGFEPADIPVIAALYWEAFGGKLGRVLGPRHKALQFIERVLDPAHAICAKDGDGTVLGVVGFKTAKGALVGGEWSDMAASYGMIGAAWRTAALSLLERDVDNERFLMDGIFVTPAARGQGVGTALLAAICDEARNRGYDRVRLDVIDTNARARALYLRQGFEDAGEQHLGLLRHIFGFAKATTMVRRVTDDSVAGQT